MTVTQITIYSLHPQSLGAFLGDLFDIDYHISSGICCLNNLEIRIELGRPSKSIIRLKSDVALAELFDRYSLLSHRYRLDFKSELTDKHLSIFDPDCNQWIFQ